MATIIRKNCVYNLLNNIKPKNFSDFSKRKCSIQWRSPRIFSATSARFSSCKHTRWRCLHTTNNLNKIVAFNLSDIGEGIREVVIKEWFVSVGDRVAQFDNICEVQSDKAAVTITSRYDGVVTKLYGKVDDMLLVGNPLVDIEVAGDEDESKPTNVERTKVASPVIAKLESENIVSAASKVLTTPAVRRIASQFNLDLKTVKATGKNGRLLKEDLLQHLNLTSDQSNELPDEATSVQAQSLQIGEVTKSGQDRTAPVSGFTRAMIKSMTESLKIPHFVLSDEYDVSELVKLRASLKEVSASRGIKLTYMPFIVKAASLALVQFPVLNSSLDAQCENIVYKAAHNIGVAMDTPSGLVVPVIKDVQNKSILEIGTELNKLQDLGSKGKLGLNEVTGGTFTISNIGNVGGTYTKPVILAPQVSIVAFGKIQILPRFDDKGGIRAAHIVNASYSADHRVIDGVTMAKFSNAIRDYLERPNNFIADL